MNYWIIVSNRRIFAGLVPRNPLGCWTQLAAGPDSSLIRQHLSYLGMLPKALELTGASSKYDIRRMAGRGALRHIAGVLHVAKRRVYMNFLHIFRQLGCGLAASLMLVLAGCGKPAPAKDTSGPPAAPDHPSSIAADPAASSRPAGPQAPPGTPTSQPPQGIRDMERVLVGYVIRTHHRPKTFEEFVAATNLQVPPPPAGKKYSLASNMHIVLVNQ